jgi:hypothetical protein
LSRIVALMRSVPEIVLSLVLPVLAAPPLRAEPPEDAAAATDAEPIPTLAAAGESERETIARLAASPSWVRRALAVLRLARYGCPESEASLRSLLADRAWPVRCYALLAAARRGVPADSIRLDAESEPRVIRTALRCRFPYPKERLLNGVRTLDASDSLEDRCLALELALAGGLDAKEFDAEKTFGEIILRMDRAGTGSLSPRLAAISGGNDSGRSYRWREWYRENRRDHGLHGGFLFPPREAWPATVPLAWRGPFANLPATRMAELETHLEDLSTRSIDVAILLDCTASMSGEIAETQSGIDALLAFAREATAGARVAIVGYRDRRDRWETRAWDFTASPAEARARLWDLSAEGGGDRPESVLPALKLAFGSLSWNPEARRVAVLVGDAPPHPGTGEQCVALAKAAKAAGTTTFAIAPHQDLAPPRTESPADTADPEPTPEKPLAPGKGGLEKWDGTRVRKDSKISPWRRPMKPGEVEYFAEIAEAGGGRAVTLPRDASLIAEIAGLTLAERYRDEFDVFFAEWMLLCR